MSVSAQPIAYERNQKKIEVQNLGGDRPLGPLWIFYMLRSTIVHKIFDSFSPPKDWIPQYSPLFPISWLATSDSSRSLWMEGVQRQRREISISFIFYFLISISSSNFYFLILSFQRRETPIFSAKYFSKSFHLQLASKLCWTLHSLHPLNHLHSPPWEDFT